MTERHFQGDEQNDNNLQGRAKTREEGSKMREKEAHGLPSLTNQALEEGEGEHQHESMNKRRRGGLIEDSLKTSS